MKAFLKILGVLSAAALTASCQSGPPQPLKPKHLHKQLSSTTGLRFDSVLMGVTPLTESSSRAGFALKRKSTRLLVGQ